MQSGSTPQSKDYFSGLQTPDVEQMKLQLEDLVQQGTLSPEQAQAILVGNSKMEDIQTDPNLEKAQMDALSGLQDISSNGGLTAADKAQLNDISMGEDTKQRGAREAILQNAQARGLGGSGIELLSQMQNQQDSATRQSARDLDVAGMAQQRALDALTKGGALAGDIRGQGFNEESAKAGAQDAIAKFNAQNQQQVGLTNVGANNAAQAANLAAKQGVADKNVATHNAQQQYNTQLAQQNYDNQIKKAAGQSGVAEANAAAAAKQSQNDANAFNKTFGTILGAGAPFVSDLMKDDDDKDKKSNSTTLSDERAKEDIELFDASDFLDKLTPSKFRYKDPKHGVGDQVGVMAQDLQKTDAGSALVHESPEGKVVDYDKSGPTVMASLASLHDRIKKLERGEE